MSSKDSCVSGLREREYLRAMVHSLQIYTVSEMVSDVSPHSGYSEGYFCVSPKIALIVAAALQSLWIIAMIL